MRNPGRALAEGQHGGAKAFGPPEKSTQPVILSSSEGSGSEYFQGNARFFVAAAPQNDSTNEFFRSLLNRRSSPSPIICRPQS
jgi:hypothetical protein